MDKTSNLPAPAQKLSKKKKSKLTPEVSSAGPSENHVEMSEQTSFIKKKSFWKSLFRFRSRKHEVPETVVDLRTPAVKIPNLDTIFEENDHQKPEDPSRKVKEAQDSQSQSQDLTDTSSTSDSTSEEQEELDQEEQPQKKIKEVNNPLTRIKIHELLQQIDETIQEFEAPSADPVTNKPLEETIQKASSGGLIKDDYSFEYSSDSASELEEDSKDTHEEEVSESKVTSETDVGEVVKKNDDSPKSSSLTDHIGEAEGKEKLNVELLRDSKTEVALGLVKEDEPDKGERRVTFVSPPIDQPVDIIPQTSQSDTTEEEEQVLKDQETSFILVDETDLDQYNQLQVSNHDLPQVPFPLPTILEEVYESATVQDSAPSIQSEQRHIEELDLSPYHQPNTHKWVEDPEDINWIEEQLRKKIEEKEKFRNFDPQSSPGTDKTESTSWSFDENLWKCPEVQPTQGAEPKWVDIDVILQRLEDNESLNRNENQLKQTSNESLTDFDTWAHNPMGKAFAPQGFAVTSGYDCIMDKTGLVGLRPKLEQIYRSEEEIEPDPDFDDNENRLSTSSDGPSLPYSRHHQASEQDEVRLDNSYKMVFHNNAIDYTVIYDPLPNERPETSTGSKPKLQKKRKILSLSHDRNFDPSIDNQISFNSPELNDAPSPKSTSVLVASLEEPGINSVLESTRKKLMQIISSINPDDRETSLYPNNFQDRININLNENQSTSEPSIGSTKDDLEAACTSLNNTTSRIKFRQESIETYDKVGQNVENMINDLLINVKDLKDDCVRAGVPDIDQPSTSENIRLRDISSRLSLVMARDILNDILEITYDKVDERGDCVWMDDSESDMNDYFISQPITNLQEQVHNFFDDYQMPFGPEILELNLISEDLSKTVEGLKKLDNFGDLSLRSKLPQNEKESSSRFEDFIDLDIPLTSNSPISSENSSQTVLDPLSVPQILVLQETMQDFLLSSKVNPNLTRLEDEILEAHPQIDNKVSKLSSGNVNLSFTQVLVPEITVFQHEEASRLDDLAVDTEILQDTSEARTNPISKSEGNEILVGVSLGNVDSVSVATEVKRAHEASSGNIDLSFRIPTENTSPQEAIEARTNFEIDKIVVEASSSKVESKNEKSNTTLEVSKTTTKNLQVNQSEASGVSSNEAPVPPNDEPNSSACKVSSITSSNLELNQIEIPGNSGNEPPTDEDPQNPLTPNPAEDQPTTISIETFPSNHPLYTNCTLKEGLQKTAGFLSTIYSELCEYNPVSYLMKQTPNLRVIPEPEIRSPGGRSDDQMVEAAGLARFEEIMAELGGVREDKGRRYSDLDCRVRGEADMMIFHRRYSELDTRVWVECQDSLFAQERDEEVERKELLTEPGCSRQMDDLMRMANKGLGKTMDEGPKHVFVVDDLFNSLETGLLDEASGYSGPSHTGKYMEDSVESARLDEASGYSSSYYTSLDPCLPNIDSDVNLVNFGSEISPDITPSTSWTQKTLRSKAFHYDEGQNDEKQFHFVPVDETELNQSFFHDFHLDGSNSSDLRLTQPETPRQIYLPHDHRLDTISEDSKLEELSLYTTINTATTIIENIENIIYPSNLDEVHTSCQNPPKHVTKNYFSAAGTPGRLEYIDPDLNNSPGESSTVSTPLDSQHLELERKLPDLNLPLSKKVLNEQIEESLRSFEDSINEMVDINRKTLEMLNSKEIATPHGSVSIISENISDPRINPNPQDSSKTKLDHEKNGKSSIKSLIRTDPDHLQADPDPETSSSTSNDFLKKHHEYLRAQKLKQFFKNYEEGYLRLETQPQVHKPDPKSVNIRVDPRFNFGIRKSKVFSDEVEHKAKVHFGEKQL